VVTAAAPLGTIVVCAIANPPIDREQRPAVSNAVRKLICPMPFEAFMSVRCPILLLAWPGDHPKNVATSRVPPCMMFTNGKLIIKMFREY
jgi:hypothetical protein